MVTQLEQPWRRLEPHPLIAFRIELYSVEKVETGSSNCLVQESALPSSHLLKTFYSTSYLILFPTKITARITDRLLARDLPAQLLCGDSGVEDQRWPGESA